MELRLKEEQQGIKYPCVSVVIPTLNEAQNLHYVLPFIPSLVSEVILVDGNSVDNTVATAKQLLPTVKIIQQTGKGKGNALRAGFNACKGDIIVMLDADGSTDPAEIPHFVEALMKGFDCAKGSRLLKGGGSYDLSFIRHLGNYLLCQFVNILFQTQISDLCYGYNAFWKDCLKCVDINCDGFEVETQIYLRMRKAQLKITEVPSIENKRIYGKSNLSAFRDGWRVLNTIVKEWIRPSSLPQPQSVPPDFQMLEDIPLQEEVLLKEKVSV